MKGWIEILRKAQKDGLMGIEGLSRTNATHRLFGRIEFCDETSRLKLIEGNTPCS